MLKVTKERPFIIAESNDSMGWGYYSHPAIAKISDNTIITYYYLAGDGVSYTTEEGMKDAGPAISHDKGKNWAYGWDTTRISGKAPERILLNTQCGVLDLGDEKIWYRSSVIPQKDITIGLCSVAWIDDVGISQGPEDVQFYTPEGLSSHCINLATRGVRLLDGSLLLYGYTKFVGDVLARSVVYKSTDNGHTWHYLSTIASIKDVPESTEGPNEVAMTLLPDNELLCIIRTGSGKTLLEGRSYDSGKTWELRKTRVSGVSPKLLLMSNGVLVLATGRPGNVLYFSTNGGHTWGNALNLTAADVRTSGYCDIVEVAPGRLLAVYDGYDTSTAKVWLWDPPNPVNAVWGVYIDVRYRGG